MTMDELVEQERAKAKVIEFLRRLLNPEELGHAVTAEVRDCARELLGMPRVETPAKLTAADIRWAQDHGLMKSDERESPDDEAWRKLRGLLPGGVNPDWQPTVEEWK